MSRDHPPLNRIVVALQVGLQILMVALLAFVIVMAVFAPTDASIAVIMATILMGLVYAAGLPLHAVVLASHRRRWQLGWVLLLTVQWLSLVWLTPYAAYLAFPLFFLFLDVMPGYWGAFTVAVMAVATVVGLGLHNGWTIGGVVGPIVGALVALLLGLTYQALRRQNQETEDLYRDLQATQGLLAASERRSGVLDERARLAREIHDTVAQDLSSIALLLNAAERKDPESVCRDEIVLARDTAVAGLAEARRFVRELTPPALVDRGIGAALRRMAEEQWQRGALRVDVRVAGALVLPMRVQTALLRITQGAMSNVVRHSGARRATIDIEQDAKIVRLVVADDGRGFDPMHATPNDPTHESFGLRATRERVEQLQGRFEVTSRPGGGTCIVVELPMETE